MTCILLHSSGYSSVFLSSTADDKELSCFKVYNKEFPLQPRHWLNISRECTILSWLGEERVDGVVQLLSVADTSKHFSLQFKACLGGNLYQCLERQECCEEEELCVKVIIPLLHVLDSLHKRGIIHRDIKPENLFFEADGKLVLGDFGLAIDSNKDTPCSRVGTREYMAPEVLSQPSADTMALRNIPTSMLTPYGTGVDIFAVGTLVHEALTGKVPFYHPEPAVMALKAQYGRPNRLPAGTSPECQAFVDTALQQDAAKRPSAAQLLKHPWVQQHAAAAAAAVAARVKAKALAMLQLDRPLAAMASCAQRSSQLTAGCPGSSAESLSSVGAAAASAFAGAQHATGIAPAGAAAQNCACTAGTTVAGASSKPHDTSSSSSSNSSSFSSMASGASMLCNGTRSGGSSSSAGRSGLLPGVAETGVAVASAPDDEQEGCKHLQKQPQHAATARAAAALPGGAAGTQAERGQRKQQGQVGAAAVAAAGMQLATSGGSSGAATDPSVGGSSSAAVTQQLQLLPALSEPVLLDVTAHSPLSKGVGVRDSSAAQCCSGSSGPRRSSESGTCSAEVAAATAAAGPACCAPPAAAAAIAAGPKCACTDSRSCTAPVSLAPAHSAPAHTGDLQSHTAGHQSRWLGTLSASTAPRRVQPGSSCTAGTAGTAVAPAAAPVAVTTEAVKAVTAAHQRPPRLRTCSMAAPGHAGGTSVSPKPLLFSPPKPTLLMQRLRSFGSSTNRGAPGAAGGSRSMPWQRRHSLDVVAEAATLVPGAAASAAAAAGGVAEPLAAADAIVDVASVSTDPPSPGSQRILKPAASTSLASPLAALCKLGGLLSPPRGAAAASAAAAAAAASNTGGHAQVPPGYRSNSSREPGSRVLRRPALGQHVTQHGTACAAPGMEALMVGWAGTRPTEVQAKVSWSGQEVTGALVSPTRSCKSAKGVCMKMLKQVLRHQQQA